MKNFAFLLFVGLMLPGTVKADSPPRYKLTVLPLSLDNPVGKGGSLNNKGQVVGTILVGRHDTSEGSQPNRRAVLWQQDHPLRRLDIPLTAPFPNSPPFSDCYPVSINEMGEVAGEFYSQDSGAITITESQAFVWRNGRMTKISGLPGNDYSEALGLNNKGEVVGTFNNNLHTVDVPPGADISLPHSFLYRGGQMTSFGFGVACGINDREEIIGEDAGKGALWLNGHRTLLGMEPMAINKWGWIAGTKSAYDQKNHIHLQPMTVACLWKNRRIIALDKPDSIAYALNSQGQVVGKAILPKPGGGSDERAFLWQRGCAYDLNSCVRLPKGWNLDAATGINDKGWIVGEGSVYTNPKDDHPESVFTFLLTKILTR